ncbi:type IV secretory system conjugative DNA transfer family protein [Parvularcula sp. LCG005]|uniref:type IV secretory system conjugative DNA transfer family protein n=1 Tax=Parvularcula sp. LCG005 TaxID=3078805 RepID=UPI002943068A|nr:type IV secretory system conjugative DNA transfer family protein [Parvularcula sp. LCG005]WOI52988.1 type IV secretory system conjugative DNA transfer family protein [Parvularcula sp. LCG005]
MSFPLLPRVDPDDPSDGQEALATAGFLASSVAQKAFGFPNLDDARDRIILGRSGNRIIGYTDDRHLVTLAGSRSGKGVSQIIPNLLHYGGSAVVIDPKGENASITARFRAEVLGQKVVVLDPFRVAQVPEELRGRLNFFGYIDPDDPEVVDDASGLAEAFMVNTDERDAHWHETARAYLKALILWIASSAPDQYRTPYHLQDLAFRGLAESEGQQPSLDLLLDYMAAEEGFGGAVSSIAAMMIDMGERERGSVLSTARRNVEFLQTGPMAACLSDSTFDLKDLRSPQGMTIYLVLPEWRLAAHARWLRLMITLSLQTLQRTPASDESLPVLFLMDEFATLGKLQAIERAASYIAGFKVKLWSILQDLGQLKDIYPKRWETFIGNAGMVTAFANTDLTTLKYLSEKLDDTEVLRVRESVNVSITTGDTHAGLAKLLASVGADKSGGMPMFGAESHQTGGGAQHSYSPELVRSRLMLPDEIARYFGRRNHPESDYALCLPAGLRPMRLQKLRYFADEPFRSRATPLA